MITLRAPKVTKYFIRHVDCRSLKVEKETKVKLSLSAMWSLGIEKNMESLNVVLGKIQGYQTLHPAEYKFKDLKDKINDCTAGELLGIGFSGSAGIGPVISDVAINLIHGYDMSDVFSLRNAITLFMGATVSLLTAGLFIARRNSAKELLNYFVEANKDISTKPV